VQAMVAHADAEARTHPVKEERDCQCLPIEKEQGRQSPEVEKAESETIDPVNLVRIAYGNDATAHRHLHVIRDTSSLAEIALTIRNTSVISMG